MIELQKKLSTVCVCIALVALTAWLGFKARNEAREYRYIGVPVERHTIAVTGEAKVVGVPDVATVELGTTIERKNVADAQKENTRIMNALAENLRGKGIDAKDIKTSSYSVYPNYDWTDGRQVLRGYTVSQAVQVKIRKLDTVGDILGVAGTLGANQVGGLRFEVDEPEMLREEARLKALLNAKEKAKALSDAAGVRLRRVISFHESGSVDQPVAFDKGYGMGGRVESIAAPAPTIEPGSNEIIVSVTLTYEIE